MRDSQQNNCDEIIDLLVKDYWSKYKSELNQELAVANLGFGKRTIRISKQFHTEFEYINKLIDYVSESLEKDYSNIPLEKCKNKLLSIVDSEYRRLIPKANARLVEAALYSEGVGKQFKKLILDEKEKSKERIRIRCALSEKAKVAVKPVNEKWYQSRTIQAAIITGVFMLIAALLTTPLWIPLISKILLNSDQNAKLIDSREEVNDYFQEDTKSIHNIPIMNDDKTSELTKHDEKFHDIKKGGSLIEPEERDGNVDRPKMSPITKIPEANIPPEGEDGTITKIKKDELVKKGDESIKPEGE